MSDRAFVIAFGASMMLHLVLLIGQVFSFRWLPHGAPRRHPLEVVYEYEIAKQELRALQERLARATRQTVASPAPTSGAFGVNAEIRIPDRPMLGTQRLSDLLPDRGAIVDLTNLVDASRGDPVLLSYFSAIREQIQRTANRRAWLTESTSGGLIYVSFSLHAGGSVRGVEIVGDRSARSEPLRETALRIVRSAAPFPPFPPSMTEPSKMIVVPLEFLVGS